jgi:hypothetical protein
MKKRFSVVSGKLVTGAILLTALERVTLWKALGVVLAKGGHPGDCRLYRRLHRRMGYSLGMRVRRSA